MQVFRKVVITSREDGNRFFERCVDDYVPPKEVCDIIADVLAETQKYFPTVKALIIRLEL